MPVEPDLHPPLINDNRHLPFAARVLEGFIHPELVEVDVTFLKRGVGVGIVLLSRCAIGTTGLCINDKLGHDQLLPKPPDRARRNTTYLVIDTVH